VETGISVAGSSAAAAISGNNPVFSGTLKIFSCPASVKRGFVYSIGCLIVQKALLL
jgi:hypothetical protein